MAYEQSPPFLFACHPEAHNLFLAVIPSSWAPGRDGPRGVRLDPHLVRETKPLPHFLERPPPCALKRVTGFFGTDPLGGFFHATVPLLFFHTAIGESGKIGSPDPKFLVKESSRVNLSRYML